MEAKNTSLIQTYFLSKPVIKLSFTNHIRYQEPTTHLVCWGKVFLCNLICLALIDKREEKKEPFFFFPKCSDHIYALFQDVFLVGMQRLYCFIALRAFQTIKIIWIFFNLPNIKQVRLLQHLLNFS